MRFLLVFFTVVLAACSDSLAVNCTDDLRPAIRAVVRDSATGAGLAPSAVAIAREDAFVDTLHAFADSLMFGVYERAGTYRLEIAHAGYQSWSRDGITVTRDQCHVRTVLVPVRLVPL